KLSTGELIYPAGTLITQPAAPMLRVITVQDLSIDAQATVQVTGRHAVALVVHGSATIDGTIDASGSAGAASSSGPGADDPANCSLGAGTRGQDATNAADGAGGGGGGGFGDSG